MEFELDNKEYIELNKLLKILGLVESGGEAHQIVDDKLVKLNGEIETRRRAKLRKGDVINFDGKDITIK